MPNVYARTLRRAAEVAGGSEELARRLGVPPAWIEHWLGGVASPPADIFLKAVDIVIDQEMRDANPGSPA